MIALFALLAPAAEPAPSYAVVGTDRPLQKVVLDAPLAGRIAGPVGATASDGTRVRAQAVPAFDSESTRLVMLLPEIAKGKRLSITVQPEDRAARTKFRWEDTGGQYSTLYYGKQPLVRYMYQAPDESSKDARFKTAKVFHHLFAPDGETLLTNGPGGKFPHHRGLFFGFNRVRYSGKQADVWHCRKGESQTHEKFHFQQAGPAAAVQQMEIAWRGRGGREFARERRRLTLYFVRKGYLIDFDSEVTTELDKVELDGDPQHAGFHFRANSEVAAKTAAKTYYVRPDGKDQPNKTINWLTPRQLKKGKKNDPRTVNAPWKAMSFVLKGKRYTAVYLDHPKNPKPARYSERNYGRFGSYFEYTLTPKTPLRVRYRMWVQPGELDVAACEMLHAGFVNPPAVKVPGRGE